MNPIVEQIGKMHFEGNLIPHHWYHTPELKLDNGKPNLVAIILLADILYWYRPTVIRDEATGQIVEVRQKFRDERLQKSYRKWGEGFGFTLRQVEDAMAFLKARGLVDVQRRAVKTEYGTLPNCAFIAPVPEAVERISSPVITGEGTRQTGRSSPAVTGEGARCKGRPLPVKRETIPKTPTKNIKDYPRTPAAGISPAAVPEKTSGGEASPVEAGRRLLAESDSAFARDYRKRRQAETPTQPRPPDPGH